MTSGKPYALCKGPHKGAPLTSGICGRRYGADEDQLSIKNTIVLQILQGPYYP